MKYRQRKYQASSTLAIIASGALVLCSPSLGLALPLLGSDLTSFAVLGASTVVNTGATTLIGDVGVSPGTAITGQSTLTVNGINALLNPGDVHVTDATAISAQGQLTTAVTSLGFLGPGTLTSADLVGLTLSPGVYTVPAGVSNLTGTLTLDGGGDANAAWVFQMPSSLITSAGSVVNVINTGAGAGVYWNVGSSATLGANTFFQGNILALTSITLGHAATIGCGRALAQTAAVTMDNNTINSIGCAGTGGVGSNGFSGGLTVPVGGGSPTFLPFVPVGGQSVPEPGSVFLLGIGLVGLAVAMRGKNTVALADRPMSS